MAKKLQMKILTTIILLALLSTIVHTVLIPNANAAEITLQQRGLSITNNVIGINTTTYSITAHEYQQETSAAYFGVVRQENIAYSLISEGSKLRIHYTFGNGNLQMIQVLEKEGTPSLVKALPNNSAIEIARTFLANYQNYTTNKLLGELADSLSGLQLGKNVTKTSGTFTFETITFGDYTNFRWYYTANVAKAPYTKYVAITCKDGFLTAFVDNWQFFNVGSTSVNLSEKEAVDIALNAAKEYAYKLKLIDYGFNATAINETNVRWSALIFDNSLNVSKTRSEDVLALYPTWRVGIALDKWYGALYGIQVNIWADNKEIRNIQEAWSTVPPPKGAPTADMEAIEESTSQHHMTVEANSNLIPWVALLTFILALTGTASIVSKKQYIRSFTLPRRRSYKTGGLLLCVLMLSLLLLNPIGIVSAWSKSAYIWGSESSGADEWGYLPPNHNWRKSALERQYQRDTSVYLTNYFQNYGGYYAYNHQGQRNPGSTKLQILNNDIDIKTAINSRIVFVTFDHGVGNYINGEFHFMFEDQTGTGIGTHDNHYWDPAHGIYDEEIYNAIDDKDRGKTILAFINTCMSGRLTTPTSETEPWQGLPPNGRARGLPFAFTHREVKPWGMQGFSVDSHMSNEGYEHPDDGSQVYIGFPKGSASCEQGIPFAGGGGNPYYWWVTSFFYNAVAFEKSINQALDAASYQFIGGLPFLATPLQTGFESYWWNMYIEPEWRNATLEVYGNGRIYLKGFGDDFIDGNYNGWTVTQGSWTASSGILRSQQSNSLIRTDQQFATNRHVRATVKTTLMKDWPL